jgi:hypothetical protein
MVIKFRHNTMFARLLQKLQKFNNGKLPMLSNRRKPYSAIAKLAFTMIRWLFLFAMGVTILSVFTAFAFSSALAEVIWTGVVPLVKLFGTTTFFVFALACLKESL